MPSEPDLLCPSRERVHRVLPLSHRRVVIVPVSIATPRLRQIAAPYDRTGQPEPAGGTENQFGHLIRLLPECHRDKAVRDCHRPPLG